MQMNMSVNSLKMVKMKWLSSRKRIDLIQLRKRSLTRWIHHIHISCMHKSKLLLRIIKKVKPLDTYGCINNVIAMRLWRTHHSRQFAFSICNLELTHMKESNRKWSWVWYIDKTNGMNDRPLWKCGGRGAQVWKSLQHFHTIQ